MVLLLVKTAVILTADQVAGKTRILSVMALVVVLLVVKIEVVAMDR